MDCLVFEWCCVCTCECCSVRCTPCTVRLYILHALWVCMCHGVHLSKGQRIVYVHTYVHTLTHEYCVPGSCKESLATFNEFY